MSNDKWGPWIGWNGGECPVGGETEVQVIVTGHGGVAPEATTSAAACFHWDSQLAPIIAYRVKKEPVVEEVVLEGNLVHGLVPPTKNDGGWFRRDLRLVMKVKSDGTIDRKSIRMTEIEGVE
jgi:hypothetical protein